MNNAELNDRAQHLLKALVERYIQGGQPVGSQALANDSGLNVSSATVRNVLSDLESMGLVASPHTSSGRVPTVQGYRMFVDSLLTVQPLKSSIVKQLEGQLGLQGDQQDLIQSASSLLSGITNLAGVVTLPRHEVVALRHIEFLPMDKHNILVVIVINDSEVHNKIMTTKRTYERSELEQAANFLNSHFAGKDLSSVKQALLKELNDTREEANALMETAVEIATQALNADMGEGDFVLDGEVNLMNYAEMSDVEKLRLIFDAFHKKQDVLHLFDQVLKTDGVQIFIGEESGYKVFGDCSVISSPYSVDGEVVGVLGVIGPTRMAYDKVIPVVDVTAKLLGSALNQQK